MLITRMLTALILAPLVAAAILWADFYWVLGLVVLVWALGAHEWAALSSLSNSQKLAYAGFIGGLIAVSDYLINANNIGLMPLMAIASLVWASALFWIVRYPLGFSAIDSASGQPVDPQSAQKLAIGIFVLVPAALALLALKRFNAEHMLYLFLLVWVADVGAYFAGRSLGTVKMVPKVSPGKSWAGLIGGLLAVSIFAWFAAGYFGLTDATQVKFTALAIAVSLVSVLGDLTQSMFKRHVAMKDSGNIFPGHGGILDRLDSTMAAAPVYLLGLYCLELL